MGKYSSIICIIMSVAMLWGAPPAKNLNTIAVQSLRASGGITESETELLSDRLRGELFKTGKVDVMERDQMQAILKEQGFQQSGACTDEGCMVEMGQLLGVRKMVMGSIGKLGSLFMINLRMIDVSTAKVVRVVSVDVPGSIENVLVELPGISMQLVDSTVQRQKIVVAPVRTEQVAAKPAAEEQTSGVLDCKDRIFLEGMNFSAAEIGFTPTKDTIDAIDNLIKDAIDDAYEGDVDIVPRATITVAPASCNAVVVRIRMDSYSTKPSSRNQFEATAKITLLFYRTPHAAQPDFLMSVERTGKRHWGNGQPLINAFDEIASALKNDLEDADYMENLNDAR